MKQKYAFVIEPGKHAKLSASSAERWMTCPGSVQLSAGMPNVSSEYAAQGTAAHYIAAWAQAEGESIAGFLGQTALVEGKEIKIDDEMLDAVQDYLDYLGAREILGDEGAIEQSFTPAMKKLHPDFGGSTDYVSWRAKERLLRVVDYKHGAGVAVDVDDNKQLKYYALGALLSNPQWNAETVELVIAQPRCDHEQGRIRSYTFPAFELLDYAADLIEAAKRTEEFGADLVPGKKQCKFCPAAAICPALEKRTHALVKADFTAVDAGKYSPKQIAEFLAMAPLVEARISAVREFAYAAVSRGEEIPGWKLVDKRATRKWRDEEEAKKTFGNAAFYTEPELRSPAQVEKIIGKKQFKIHEEVLVEKKSSGHTLAPTSDPRPSAHAALLEDFSVVNENAEEK